MNANRMKTLAVTSILTFLILGLSLLRPAVVDAASHATLTEWTVPTLGSGPRGLALGPSGDCCWFLEYFGNKVGHLDPNNNTFQEWSIPTRGANPNSLAITSISGSLTVWGTESGTDKIFSFSPRSGLYYEYNLTATNSGVLGVGGVSVEPSAAQVRVWFTEAFNNTNVEFVYNPQNGNVTIYEDLFPASIGGGAYGVYAGSGSVWYAGFSALVRWDRASSRYTMWPLPSHGSALARSITLDQYGQAWYVQGVNDAASDDNFVGVLRGNNTIQEWRLPKPGSDPRGISIDPITEQPWIAEASAIAGNGTIASLDTLNGGNLISLNATTAASAQERESILPTTNLVSVSSNVVIPTTNYIFSVLNGQFTEYAVGRTQPQETVVDSSGNIWMNEPGTNKIAKLSRAPDFALRVSPLTRSQGSSGIVTITGASISGYTGQVTLGAIVSSTQGVTLSSFTPNPFNIPSSGSTSTQLSISIASNAPNGTSVIVVKGMSGNITHQIGLRLTVTNSTSVAPPSASRCLIATATYGSDLSPEVQLLRNFRDNSLEKSKTGSSFLVMFNAWYYSFSPSVANYLQKNVIARTFMKGILYPLIAFLFLASRLYTGLSAYPELATVLSGLLTSALMGAFYIGLPLGLLVRRLGLLCYSLKIWGVVLLTGIAATLFGQILALSILLMISTSVAVLSAMFASATLTVAIIFRLTKARVKE